MSNKYDEPIYVCEECGSSNVREPAWVYANRVDSLPIVGDRIDGVDFDLCDDCDAQMEIISKEEYEKREEQA